MNGLENIIFSGVIAILVIAFLVYRQLRPRKLSKRGLLIIPGIILFFLIKSVPSFTPTQTKLLEILIMSVVSITLGLFACRELRVYKGTAGKAMAKGSWKYFLFWLAALIIKSILSILFGETSLHTVSQTEIFLPIFFLMATRNAYLYWRTKKLGLTLH